MVLKKLTIFLALLWTIHQCMAKRVIKAKYRETRVVNYRHDNKEDMITKMLRPYQLVHFLIVMSIE